jgi:hypothetical protein
VTVDPRHEPPEAAEAPPTGEEIHLPGPTPIPALLAAALACALVGVTVSWALTILGGVVAIVLIVVWIRQTRRDVGELPVEH